MLDLKDPRIIHTKLLRPRSTGATIFRERLCQISGIRQFPSLNVIKAPAGYGKSTLAMHWIEQAGLPSAWYTIDSTDNDVRQWVYSFFAAIRTVIPNFGDQAGQHLDSLAPNTIESMLPSLLDAISDLATSLCLVLDNYHLIHNDLIHKFLCAVIALDSEHLHLIIVSRNELPKTFEGHLSYGRTHIVQQDSLLFTACETDELFRNVFNIELNKKDINRLLSRTEGWGAGLLLASELLKKSNDIPLSIQSFDGTDRLTMRYFFDEVYDPLPNDLKAFILKISLLKRFCAPLCEKITGLNTSKQLLSWLVDKNLFLISLDSEKIWFRFHHLFSDMLRAELLRTQAESFSRIYLNAYEWHKENQYFEEAMHYALRYAEVNQRTVRSFGPTLEIFDLYSSKLLSHGWNSLVSNLSKEIPHHLLNNNPFYMLNNVWDTFLEQGITDRAQLHSVQSYIDKETTKKEIAKQLSDDIMILQAFQKMQKREIDFATHLVNRALPERANQLGPKIVIATDLYSKGHLRVAETRFREAITHAYALNHAAFIGVAIAGLCCTLVKEGRLIESCDTIKFNSDKLKSIGIYHDLFHGTLFHLILGEISYKRNQLTSAVNHFEIVEIGSRNSSYEELGYLARAYIALINWHFGKKTDARAALERISENRHKPALIPFFNTLSLLIAKLSLIMGDSQPAFEYIAAHGISDKLVYETGKEDESLLFIRLLSSTQNPDSSIPLISQLFQRAEQNQQIELMIELSLLRSIALYQSDMQREAASSLETALTLSQPDGYVRIFIDEATHIEPLLTRIANEDGNSSHAETLLKLISTPTDDAYENHTECSAGIDSLSKTEMRILKFLIQGLSNKEIANTKNISINTVKTHIRNIYSKLGVNNRTKAIILAKESNLFID